ncbi:MAG TPA: glycosyltransferase family 4 protein [Candidatus Binatia bacterium]|nr:glycosyltransferase family 4 protein [Candidatus Binatia bacterium]
MRIALVLAGPFPALRGSQVLVEQLATGLGARGHAVRLVTYGAGGDDLPGPQLARVGRDLRLVARLWRVVRREAIDVIHAHNYEAALAGLVVSRTTGRPLVYHGHNAMADELPTYFRGAAARRLARVVGRTLDAHVPRRADFCIAVSPELHDILRRRGVAAAGVACISPAGTPRELGPRPAPAPGDGFVCYAGNLDGYQNLDFLRRSFAHVRAAVPRARLVFVTHPGARPRPEPAEGMEVVEARSYEEVRARLAAADVAVCPRAEPSGFPMKLLNYMAAGKAIVACAGSAKGLRDGETARVVPDGDERAFAAAVVELLTDATVRDRLGAAARRAVEDPRAWERVLDRIEQIYRTVLAARGAASVGGGAPVLAGTE